MRRAIIIILFLIPGFLLSTMPVFSASLGLGVYPPLFRIRANPGAQISIPIRVKNLDNRAVEAEIQLRPFISDQNGRVNFVLYKHYTSQNSGILGNVRVLEGDQNISKVLLSPGQEKNLSLNIQVEPDQKDMDYYFSVVFLSSADGKSHNSYTNLRIGVASNVLLAIGSRAPEVSMRDFSTSLFSGEGRLKFEGKIENNEKHFASVHPKIIVKNIFGKTLEVIDLSEQNILAGTKRTLTSSEGSSVIISNRKYFFGPYLATLSIAAGSGKTIERSKTTVVLPGKDILLTTGLALLIILVISRVRRKRSN